MSSDNRNRERGLLEPEEDFEILDLTKRNWIQKAVKDLTAASAAKQITVGGVSGWCSGYVFAKVGKAAAFALGGSLLILQIAHHKGYVVINWSRIEKNMKTYKNEFEKNAKGRIPIIMEQVRDFAAENMLIAGSYFGGFLIGLAC